MPQSISISPHLFLDLQTMRHLAVIYSAGTRVDIEQVGDAGTQTTPSLCLHCTHSIVLQEFL